MLNLLTCKIRSILFLSLFAVPLPVCLPFLENKNYASYSRRGEGPGYLWCSDLSGYILTFILVFQCPSSPPTLSWPQTALPSLQAHDEMERWVVSDIHPSQAFFSQKEQQHWVKSFRVKPYTQGIAGGTVGTHACESWSHCPLNQRSPTGSFLGKTCPFQSLVNKPSWMQAGLQLGWKREGERLFSKPCSDPRFDKPTLFLSSPSLTSHGYDSSVYECKCFLGHKQVRECCASRIMCSLFHQGTCCNTKKCCLCPLSVVFSPSSSSDSSPVLPHGGFGFLEAQRLEWSISDQTAQQPWVCVSKRGWGYIIFLGGREVKGGKTLSKTKAVLVGCGSQQRHRGFSGNTQTRPLCDNVHLVPMAFGRENMVLGFSRHSDLCRLCFSCLFTCLKASWSHWGLFRPLFPAFVNWVERTQSANWASLFIEP